MVAYQLFSHVRVRVLAWQDPLSRIENEGYQICQSLFAIGTGGWFGMGLYQGMPEKIPVVEQDFIFSAIAEEMGGIFAICLLMVCISCFLMFFNVAMQMKEQFYKLIALGLGTVYGFRCSSPSGSHKIYSVDRSHASACQLRRKLAIFNDDHVCRCAGLIHQTAG